MTKTDSLQKQLDDIRSDMRGISPKTSTYQRLAKQSAEIGAALQQLKDARRESKELKCDDTVFDAYIPTPRGWKCTREGCNLRVRHRHSTYTLLNAKTNPSGKKG